LWRTLKIFQNVIYSWILPFFSINFSFFLKIHSFQSISPPLSFNLKMSKLYIKEHKTTNYTYLYKITKKMKNIFFIWFVCVLCLLREGDGKPSETREKFIKNYFFFPSLTKLPIPLPSNWETEISLFTPKNVKGGSAEECPTGKEGDGGRAAGLHFLLLLCLAVGYKIVLSSKKLT